MLSRLFIAALWSPEGKELTRLVHLCGVYCDSVTYPFGILGQVRYLIVSTPDPCCLSYFLASSVSTYDLSTISTTLPDDLIKDNN